ncbi:MAG: hypothetical protein AAB316_00220 [Bacteroidota bacterium]
MKYLCFFACLILGASCASGQSCCAVSCCASGSGYGGILPQFHKHFAGIRYTQRSLKTTSLPSILHEIPDLTTEQQYQTMEFFGRFYPVERVQVFAFLPFNRFSQTNNGETLLEEGLGDVTLLANYNLLDTGDSLSRDWKHNLLLGGGVKLPTGSFKPNIADGDEYQPTLQTGTGSLDFLANLAYTLRFKQWGIQADAGFRFNSTNQMDYRFGNRIQGGMRVFRQIGGDDFSILPNLGLQFEAAQKDRLGDETRKFTGGRAGFVGAGVQVFVGNISFDASFQQPFFQSLSEGHSNLGGKFVCQAICLF